MAEPTTHRGRYRLHRAVDDMTRRRHGDANPRGGLERPDGPFRLREGLNAPGDLPFGEALALVAEDWARQTANGTISVVTEHYARELRGLAVVLARLGIPLVRDVDPNTLLMWIKMPRQDGQPPLPRGSMGMRRAAARAFFQTAFCLGLHDSNPAKVVELPRRDDRYVNAFRDEQIAHLKRVARGRIDDTRNPAILALVMCGAATGEVPFCTVRDVDLANRRVWVHDGGYRQRDRWIPLDDDWCLDAVERRVRDVLADPSSHGMSDPWLVYRPHPTDPSIKGQKASAGVMLTNLLKRAGIYEPGVVRVESIREWLAARVFHETGSIEAVAVRLGMSSLDAAAHIVGVDWVAERTVDGPPAHRVVVDGEPA